MNAAPQLCRATFALLLIAATLCHAAPDATGRWEGEVRIPGAPMRLIVDLAPDAQSGWAGSVIVPGYGVKGAALADIVVADAGISFTLAGALNADSDGPARVQARLVGDDTMAGEFRQGGNAAALALKRTGAAQVERAPQGTAVARELEGTWTGSYELGGSPRHVTLTLVNHDGAAATAEFVIVGKRTNQIPVDRVIQSEHFLKIESGATGITIEGRWRTRPGEIDATFQQGPFELPLLLRRGVATPPKPS